MSNSKKMLSFLLAVIIIVLSVTSSTAVIAPEDSISAQVQWMYKIDDVLLDKMSNAAETDLIPVWVWMTDIDMEQLDKDIETRTGVSQQKLDTARAEIGFDVSTVTAYDLSDIDSSASAYREATKAQREQIANDTEVYLAAKKSLASQRYTTANTAKIRQIGVSNNRIDFQSTLTPSFIAFLTKAEIIETAQSDNVVEMGYFSEYDAESTPAPTQARAMAEDEETSETEAPSELPTLDVSTLHTGIKQVIQHDDALEKYGVTGNGIKVLHVDHDYVRSDHENINLVPNRDNIQMVIQESTYYVTATEEIPIPTQTNHANFTVSYLQAFAEDVMIYSVAKPSAYGKYNEDPQNTIKINTYNDIEYAVDKLDVDVINNSCHDRTLEYPSSYSAKWYDAIVAMYNIPLIASAGNNAVNNTIHVIAPASGYNSIAVGAYDYSNNQMEDYSYNPLPTTETDTSRVTYKPDLVVAMNPGGGTSAGAPVVSALVAMMMEQEPMLKGQPEVIKAILMASCQEKALPGTTNGNQDSEELMKDGLTLKQGAGKVNAFRTLNIVEYGTYGNVTILPSQLSKSVSGIYLNSQVYGNENISPMNVSISWLQKNVKYSNNKNHNDIVLGARREFDLLVFHPTLLTPYISDKTNSGKQLVFIPQPPGNREYIIQINKADGYVNNGQNVTVGYAFSVGNFEKVLEKVEITGQTAIGKTLTANAYTADGVSAETSALSYQWLSSIDGNNWTFIDDATLSTYTLTSADVNKYFKCIVEQNYLWRYELEVYTDTSVVRYGDVTNDGLIDIYDTTLIQRSFMNLVTLTPEQIISADVNGDGMVDSLDVTLIQRYCSGMIDKFPIEE